MKDEPFPPHSFVFEHGKTRITARGAGLVALILLAVVVAGLLAIYRAGFKNLDRTISGVSA